MRKLSNFFHIKKREFESRQAETHDHSKTYQPPTDPKLLLLAYKHSFVIHGIANLVATTASQWWEFWPDVSDELKALLYQIDQKELFLSLFVFGNFYLERIYNSFGQTKKLRSFLTRQIEKKKSGGWVQKVNGKETFFEDHEVIAFREASIESRHYGDSHLTAVFRQISLLQFIDTYYSNLFDGGMMGTKILTLKNSTDTLTDDMAEAINTALTEKASGIDNAFDTLIFPVPLEKLDIDDIGNTDKFLKYREDLIQAIANALNTPVDMLLPQRASRATVAESIARFNTDVIFPLQERAMQALKIALMEEFGDIDGVEFAQVDTKNHLQEMEVLATEMQALTGYKNAGIMTTNEIREKLELESVADGDTLATAENSDFSVSDDVKKELSRIEKNIAKIYEEHR